MELSKKTTILFPPDLHAHLARLARQSGVSLGHLVREACETRYGRVSGADRVAAAEEIRALSLPVASTDEMKRESIPDADELLP